MNDEILARGTSRPSSAERIGDGLVLVLPDADRFADSLGAAASEIPKAADLNEALAGAVFLDHVRAEGTVEGVRVDTGSADQVIAAGTARKPISARPSDQRVRARVARQ